MTIQLNPEIERLVQEELKSGHFHWIDEIILQGIRSRRGSERTQGSESKRPRAVERALDFAKHRAVALNGI